ncbi:AtpZ/AtpI family protein [Aureimonas psammosilenae]|uniref:AtpZ/AtpI family protein n=1 Tax=Aureimonas psammosilenae TaxID=2495496 RepID=UPI001260F8C2|nr:AtpZ/AtpI family protein [Aureimonas psammosilenae]
MSDHDDKDLKRQGDDLERRIAESRSRLPGNRPEANPTQGMRGAAEGFKIASEFVAGILVGVAIGYGIDQFFGTTPFGLIVFLMIGFAAGVRNVIRATTKPANPPDTPPR